MSRSNLCDYIDAYIVVKGTVTVEGDNDAKKINRKLTLRIMLHLDHVYQKSITHLQTMQKILIFLRHYTIFRIQ